MRSAHGGHLTEGVRNQGPTEDSALILDDSDPTTHPAECVTHLIGNSTPRKLNVALVGTATQPGERYDSWNCTTDHHPHTGHIYNIKQTQYTLASPGNPDLRTAGTEFDTHAVTSETPCAALGADLAEKIAEDNTPGSFSVCLGSLDTLATLDDEEELFKALHTLEMMVTAKGGRIHAHLDSNATGPTRTLFTDLFSECYHSQSF